MRQIKLFILTMIIGTSLAQAGIENDKKKHMLVGTAIYGACLIAGKLIESMDYNNYLDSTTCLVPVFVAGAGKELYDSRHSKNHSAEFSDFAYTVGIPLGVSFVLYEW